METIISNRPLELDLLTMQEAADVLRCSRTHVYRLVVTGQLTATDISTARSKRAKLRIRAVDLQNYLTASITA
jgi:excisionase family DNA binding protein